MNFTEEQINEIKEKLQYNELFEDDDIEKLKEYKKEIGVNSITFAKLFITCYDCFYLNSSIFESYDKEFKNKLCAIKIEELRSLVERYNNGNSFGDYYILENIRKMIQENRSAMMELIIIFFKLFSEEG